MIKTSPRLIVFILVLSASIFLFDISIPLGVAGGVPYVAVILVSLWSPSRPLTINLAVLCTALTLIGYFISPFGGELWKVLTNRLLAIFAIWVTALVGIGRKRTEEALKEAHDKLELRVEERTRKLSDEIEERERAESAQQESEERYRALFEQAADSILLIDAQNGEILEFNHKAYENLGYTREEFRKLKIADFEVVESPEEVAEHVRKVREEGSDIFETKQRRKDGEILDVLVNTRLISFGGKDFILSILSDITKRKQAEEALKQSENKYRTLFENIPQKIFLKDTNSVYISCNTNYANDLKIKPEDICGRTDYDFYDKKSAEKYRDDDKAVVEAGEIKDIEESYIQDGKPTFVHTIKVPVKKDDGTVMGVLGIFWDITEQKQAKEALQNAHDELEANVKERTKDLSDEIAERKKAEEQLKASLEEKEVLLKEIHHRVKNNLQIISSMLNLQSGYIKDKSANDVFQESQNRIRSMALIHEKLYQSSDLANIDFSEYVRTLSATLFRAYNVSSSNVVLKVSVADTSLDIDTTIQLGLILNELVSNSLKHAFPAGTKGELNIELLSSKRKYRLIVSDDGKGLPDGFDFRNSESLGLNLVNTLTRQLGGEIKLDRGNGTKFKIIFPH